MGGRAHRRLVLTDPSARASVSRGGQRIRTFVQQLARAGDRRRKEHTHHRVRLRGGHGYAATAVGKPEAALEALEREFFDVAFLDLRWGTRRPGSAASTLGGPPGLAVV